MRMEYTCLQKKRTPFKLSFNRNKRSVLTTHRNIIKLETANYYSLYLTLDLFFF